MAAYAFIFALACAALVVSILDVVFFFNRIAKQRIKTLDRAARHFKRKMFLTFTHVSTGNRPLVPRLQCADACIQQIGGAAVNGEVRRNRS
jgi:hypothetical protein